MPKRKRDDQDSPEDGKQRSKHGPQRKRVEEKLFHAQKLIHRALKVAKGFERQKLGRRQKTAAKEKDEATLTRLEAEIEALKILDLSSTAEAHLYKTLLKDKAISQSPALPEKVSSSTKSALDTATANVTARLYNSKPVKDAIAEAMPGIRSALGLPAVSRKIKKELVKRQTGKSEDADGASRIVQVPAARAENVSGTSSEDGNIRGERGTYSQHSQDTDDEHVEDEDQDNFAALDPRLAEPSDEEYSSGSDEEEEDFRGRSLTASAFKPTIDLSLSPSPSLSRSPSPVSKTRAVKRKATTSGPAASRMFLPSLTMGGYVSGSDSEAEVLSDADVAPRKNRRGQRARQQIWEKKFGKKAKHLQEEPKRSSNQRGGRDDGWDLKRGAQEEGSGKGGRYQPAWMKARNTEGRGGAGGFASGGNATQVVLRKPKVDTSNKPLHPSWEAAKKAKEKKMETGAFAGKKIVF